MDFSKLTIGYRMAKIQADAILKELSMNEKGETEAIKLVVGIFLVAVLAGALLPSGINSVVAGRNTSWSAGTLGAYDAISILLVVAVIAAIAGIAMRVL